MLKTQQYFDQIYATSQDPWGYEQRWYEQRKRQICLGALLKPHYQQALEIGCSNGVLSAALAPRCEQLLCLDGHSQAIAAAKLRLADASHVHIQQAWIPEQLPDQQFDLIVVSEILYYLEPEKLQHVIAWLEDHLADEGTLLCCHWRHPIAGFELTGDHTHLYLQQLSLKHYLSLHEPDFILDVWTNMALTLSEQEGLR